MGSPGLPPSPVQRPRIFGIDHAVAVLEQLGNELRQARCALASGTRSCGRLGPARLGSTLARSSSSVDEYCASGWPGSWNKPLRLAVGLDELHLLLARGR